MNFIRQGLGIALQPELTLKSIAGELCSVPLEPTFYRQISLLAKEKPVEGSPLFLLQTLLFIKKFYCLIREISKQPIYTRFVIQSII